MSENETGWPIPENERELRARIAAEIEQKITDWEPTCTGTYIRGMRAALLWVTGEAYRPLWEAWPAEHLARAVAAQPDDADGGTA